MMVAWSFAARLIDEVASLLRMMGKHRYLKEADHRIHWTVDAALADVAGFDKHAARFEARRKAEPELDVASRDPSLWRPATVDEVVTVLTCFWGPGDVVEDHQDRLVEIMEEAGLEISQHHPFQSDPEEPPFPELVTLDWELLPVDQLDTERHKGALEAMADSGEEVNPSQPIYQEGPAFSAVELLDAAPRGILDEDFLIWSEEPYAYADYVFRGVSKAARLPEPPVGYRDIVEDEEFDEGEQPAEEA